MSRPLTLLSPAKLNLFLHIVGRRPDGYHQLQTLFQLLDWGDQIQFTANASGEVRLSGDSLGIPPQENLIIRAALALPRNPQQQGVDIHLQKHIPAGGGLGGGSSNAATTLLALNQLWGLGLPLSQLQQIGAQLGADVPVFVAGHSAWAEGIGDVLTPVQLPERWYLVLMPECQVGTREIFSHQQLTRDTSPIKIAAFFEGQTRNDCQNLVRSLHPEVNNALNWLDKFGNARMTGTGACVFCGFQDEHSAQSALSQAPRPLNGFVARGVNESPVLDALARLEE